MTVNSAIPTQQTKKCPYCGENVPAQSQKCSHCGEWLVKRYGKSWVKTYLLCSFLGGLGIHDFYNNKTGFGIAKILTCFGFFGAWAIIDCFLILCDVYTDSEGRKLSRKPTIQSTALLCFFGGAGGWHRFYTGHIALAWLQFVSSFFGIGIIWAIVDFFTILMGKFKDANGNYIK